MKVHTIENLRRMRTFVLERDAMQVYIPILVIELAHIAGWRRLLLPVADLAHPLQTDPDILPIIKKLHQLLYWCVQLPNNILNG